VSVQVVGLSSMEHLKEAVRIGREFKPLTPAEMETLMAKVRDVQSDGRFEQFKTTNRYESPYHRAQHGF
jgi:predicted aldo/keto reductase-like oxidoreductase